MVVLRDYVTLLCDIRSEREKGKEDARIRLRASRFPFSLSSGENEREEERDDALLAVKRRSIPAIPYRSRVRGHGGREGLVSPSLGRISGKNALRATSRPER